MLTALNFPELFVTLIMLRLMLRLPQFQQPSQIDALSPTISTAISDFNLKFTFHATDAPQIRTLPAPPSPNTGTRHMAHPVRTPCRTAAPPHPSRTRYAVRHPEAAPLLPRLQLFNPKSYLNGDSTC